MAEPISADARKLAAIAYGEASERSNDPQEVRAIAFTFANRMRAWGLSRVDDLLREAGSGYVAAARNNVTRYRLLMTTSVEKIRSDDALNGAVKSAEDALINRGDDPSNGAYWWDGRDLRSTTNPRHQSGFRYGDSKHNILGVEEVILPEKITYWTTINKKTKKETKTERGRYSYKYVSTAAIGETIFWKASPEYIKASGAKDYK